MVGHWKYEIGPLVFLKAGLLGLGVLCAAYYGESCHVKQRIDEFRRTAPIAATSANPYTLSIEGVVESVGGERRIYAYLENRTLEVRYPLDPDGHTRRTLEQMVALPEVRAYIDSEVARKVEERSRVRLAPSHGLGDRDPPKGFWERVRSLF